MSLSGSNALVTGGGSGIGLGCARWLLRAGATVTIAGRSEQRLTETAAALKGDAADGADVRWAVCDATDEASMADAVAVADAGNGLRIVVASAGVAFGGPVAQTPLDAWRTVIDTNLTGVFVTLKHTAPVLRRNGGGAFTAISSIAATMATRYVSAYTASKAGVDMLVRSAANELGAWGIRVNSVRPGVVPTDMTSNQAGTESVERSLRENIVLGRVGSPDDIAAAVGYLSGPDAGWVTGACLDVDGGNALRSGTDFTSLIRQRFGTEWVPEGP